MLDAKTANEKVVVFHRFLREHLDQFFPQKSIKKSNFDKKWFTPAIKAFHRKKQREFVKNRHSAKYKEMDKKFKKMKKSSIRDHYQNLTEKFKATNPKKFFSVMKEICNPNFHNNDFLPEILQNLTPFQRSEKIAAHFSQISQSYEPVNLSKLPSFLPALPPPQVTE